MHGVPWRAGLLAAALPRLALSQCFSATACGSCPAVLSDTCWNFGAGSYCDDSAGDCLGCGGMWCDWPPTPTPSLPPTPYPTPLPTPR